MNTGEAMSAERFVNGSLTLELREEATDVVVEWIGRSIARPPERRTSASVRDFSGLASDEPAALAGSDLAPNPVEQVGCLVSDEVKRPFLLPYLRCQHSCWSP